MKRKLFHSLIRWVMVLATLIFVGQTFYYNWQALGDLEIQPQAWIYAIAALGLTLLSHCSLGILWGWILQHLQQPIGSIWALRVYLLTDPAKYLPGDIWHMYGRIRATKRAGISLPVGTLSVLLEPIFNFAAAMVFALLNVGHSYLQALSAFSLVCILIGLYPPAFARIMQGLNQLQHIPGLRQLSHWLQRRQQQQQVGLERYPVEILLGELLSMGLRCVSFLLVLLVFTSLNPQAIAPVIGGFSFAWILGLVLPGASGGIGIFEAIAIALLSEVLPTGVVLGAISMYRLITILVSVLGAGIGWLIPQRQHESQRMREPVRHP